MFGCILSSNRMYPLVRSSSENG